MGPMGNVDTGGNRVQGIWGTWAMRLTGQSNTWGIGCGSMGHMGNEGPQGVRGTGVWATWAIGAQGVWGTWGMGHMVNRLHGQWGTWAMGPHYPYPCTLLPM